MSDTREKMENSCDHVGRWDLEADGVIAGAAQGGLCAAISAAEEGVRVLLIEIQFQERWGIGFFRRFHPLHRTEIMVSIPKIHRRLARFGACWDLR